MSSTDTTRPNIESESDRKSLPVEPSPHVETVSRDRYVLGAEFARGGIGRILHATDKRLERQVALKELLEPNPELEARFLQEALVTARLQHPAIVPVYDIGRFPNGEIFYAMKFVSGRSLGDIVAEAKSFDKRLALLPHVLAVAEAIAYAHNEHIVHRDLKPANVLIGPFGETVVIDWGIAKDLREAEISRSGQWSNSDEPPNSSSSLTMAGAVLGTPGYMPPEQAAGEPVDERADVYALGAILYHVLSGVAPYDGQSGLDVITKVLTEPPLPLSARERGVPRDLLAIVAKAMARDPADRYRTASEFARDLRLFETGQIVGAYHYSPPERLVRFIQRNRAVVATTFIGLVVTSIIASTSLSRVFEARRIAELERDRAHEERVRAQQKQSEAESARQKATQQTDELIVIEARAAARHDPNASIAWLKSLSADFDRWGEARLIAADAQEYGIATVLDGHSAALNMAAYSPNGAVIATASDDRTLGIWNADGTLIRKLEGHSDEVWRMVFSRDSRRLLSSSKDGTARIWDLETGKNLAIVRGGGPEVEWAEFMGDENHVLLMNCTQKRVELHDVAAQTFTTLPGEIVCPGSLHVSPNGQKVAYAADGHIRLMDLATREYRDYKNTAGRCMFVYAAPDTRHLGCSGEGGYSSLWEAKTGRILESVTTTNTPGMGAARFARDNRHFLMSKNTTMHVFNLETGEKNVFDEHAGPIFSAFFSPDGRKIATTSYDRTTVVFDLEHRTHQAHFGFQDTTCWADFSPDQRSLVVASWDHTARIFPVDKSRNRIITRGSSPVTQVRFSPDGQTLISSRQDGSVRIDSIDANPTAAQSMMMTGEAHVLSADGSRIAFGTRDGVIHVHSPGKPTNEIRLVGHETVPRRIHFSSSGSRLLSVDNRDCVRIWDLDSGQGRVLLKSNTNIVVEAFSDDENHVATGDSAGIVRVFPVSKGTERTLEGHIGRVESLAFLPDNARLASGGKDHTLRIWDLATGNMRSVDASGFGIMRILVSPDGTTVYTLGSESSIRRWNVNTGEALRILRGHRSTVIHVELSPEGKRLLSAGTDGEIRLWDLTSGESRQFEGHEGPVAKMMFSPQGDKFTSAGTDATVRIWYDDLPFDGPGLRTWMSKAIPTLMDAAPPAK